MKQMVIFFLVIACFSCSKEEAIFSSLESISDCDNSTVAVVEFMTASVSGVDDFYYLRIVDEENGKEELVYPKQLSVSYKENGTKLKVNFAYTSDIYRYIICLPGHQLDANNPDESEMRIIDICDIDTDS